MWEAFIDLVTLVWFVVFVLEVAGIAGGWAGPVSCVIAGVYVVDLVVIARRSYSVREFFRRAWLDLLLLIPFFRIFRMGRVARFFRVKKLARVVRKKRILSRVFRPEVLEASVEGLDLFQKSAERLFRLSFLFRR
jgi:hypothetical protein